MEASMSKPKDSQNPSDLQASPNGINGAQVQAPTTFFQADTSSFKQVVQMLTGSSETIKQASNSKLNSPSKTSNPIRKQGFKLYERRNSLNSLKISPNCPGFSMRKQEMLSPSVLIDLPSLVLSPVTPLISDPFNLWTACDSSLVEERFKAVKDNQEFCLHESPVLNERDSKPRLLPLFPVTSPRVTGSSSS